MAFTEQQEKIIKQLILQDFQLKGLDTEKMLLAMSDMWFQTKAQRSAYMRTILQTFRDRDQRGLDEIDIRRATEITNRTTNLAQLDELLAEVDKDLS